jgi:hypothetical protein
LSWTVTSVGYAPSHRIPCHITERHGTSQPVTHKAWGQAHRSLLDDAVPDIERLIEFHTKETGTAPGRRLPDIQIVSRSAVVMTCAYWEAFCEDLAAEALRHLAEHAADATKLPDVLKKTLKAGLLNEPHELAIWDRGSAAQVAHSPRNRRGDLREREPARAHGVYLDTCICAGQRPAARRSRSTARKLQIGPYPMTPGSLAGWAVPAVCGCAGQRASPRFARMSLGRLARERNRRLSCTDAVA